MYLINLLDSHVQRISPRCDGSKIWVCIVVKALGTYSDMQKNLFATHSTGGYSEEANESRPFCELTRNQLKCCSPEYHLEHKQIDQLYKHILYTISFVLSSRKFKFFLSDKLNPYTYSILISWTGSKLFTGTLLNMWFGLASYFIWICQKCNWRQSRLTTIRQSHSKEKQILNQIPFSSKWFALVCVDFNMSHKSSPWKFVLFEELIQNKFIILVFLSVIAKIS